MSSAPPSPGRLKRWGFPLLANRSPSNTLVVESGPGEISLDDFEPFLVRKRNGPGSPFVLPLNESLARKRTFRNRWKVLPNEVADISCRNMTPEQLLVILNTIFGTRRRLDNTLRATLSDFITDGCDIGQLYGNLRFYWSDGGLRHKNLRTHVQDRQLRDQKLRESMIVNDLVITRFVPPRRVWDLYANRVIPYCHRQLSTYIYPVSHSWRPSSERHSVLTTINGKEWRVPIPRDTTLDAIRNELLLLGAEYVWLDVLCLRQFDENLPEQEDIRKREWRLDIPTIGSIYPNINHAFPPNTYFGRHLRAVIIWFNGLGRPFCDGPVDPDDSYNWMNRVWTMQELGRKVIIAGLQHKLDFIDLKHPQSWPSAISNDFLTLLSSQPFTDGWPLTPLSVICAAVRRRSYSNPVDQVSCLSYFLFQEIPIYDPDTAPEVAWGKVVKNITATMRTILLLTDFGIQPSRWQPTWDEFINCTKFEGRRAIDLEPLYREGDTYYLKTFVLEQVRIHVPQARSDGDARGTVSVSTGAVRTFTISKWTGNIDSDVEYILACCGDHDNWVVAKKIGTRTIDNQMALDVVKVSAVTANNFGAWRISLTTQLLQYVVIR